MTDATDGFLDALRDCVAILSHGPHDRSKWQHDAREAVQRLVDGLNKVHTAGAVLDGIPGPWEVHSSMIDFINGKLSSNYVWNAEHTIKHLPAPRSWVRQMEDFLEDCGGPRSDSPKEYTTSWREILVALGLKNNTEDRERVRNLNAHYGGPIVFPGQGAQPKADRNKLIAWWNSLESQWTTGHARGRDSGPTTSARHGFGRGGEVVPEIRGGVKKRRADRES
ncbi:MAG: hypothetical protein HQ582_20215 [Planctomycetes bacterium]|nr:hypothetical protein [Planctomycetota bacterium]